MLEDAVSDAKKINGNKFEPFFKKLKINHQKNIKEILAVLDIITFALFIRMGKSGRCGEDARLICDEFLESDHDGCVEVVQVTAKSTGAPHDFNLFNRSINSDIAQPKTWGKQTVRLDLWADITDQTSDSTLTTAEIARTGKIEVAFEIASIIRITKPLSQEYCGLIIEYLMLLQEMFNAQGKAVFYLYVAQITVPNFNAEQELANLQRLISN